MTSVNSNISTLVRELYSKGKYKKVIKLCELARKSNSSNIELLRVEIIALLIVGREKKALNLSKSYGSKYDLDPSFMYTLERFVNRSNLDACVEHVINFTSEVLSVSLKKRHSNYANKLLKFDDIVVISNSAALFFSESDKLRLRSLNNPLFVYLNIGNQKILDIRDTFYPENAYELIIGGHHHIFDSDFQLFFSPKSIANFLGCLVRVNSKFQKIWNQTLYHKAKLANPDLDIFELEEALLIDSLYPLSIINSSETIKMKRIPTIGWIAISYLDAIISTHGSAHSRLWLSGFSLNPSYIFGGAGHIRQHDFAFERHALDYRYKNNLALNVGQYNPKLQELNTPTQLVNAGFSKKQLSHFLRANKLI